MVLTYRSIFALSKAWPFGVRGLNTVGAGAGSGKSMFMASASFRIFASAMGLIAGCARKTRTVFGKDCHRLEAGNTKFFIKEKRTPFLACRSPYAKM
jgi:hypothetical protein